MGGFLTGKTEAAEDAIFRIDNVVMTGKTGDTTTLNGGSGLDTLIGSDGQDIFLFDNTSNVDVIHKFSTSQGDALDISDILSGYNPATSAITDFLQITTVGGNSEVRVDANGTTGGASFVQIATITGVTGLTDEAALLATGNIIVV